MTILSKAIYRLNALPIKLTMAFLTELEKKCLQFVWKHKRPWIAIPVWRKKNGARGINLPNFRQYYKASFIKIVGHWHKQKYRPMEQDRKPRHKPMHLWVPYFWQGGKNIQWGRNSLFNKWCWENWTSTCKRMKLEHVLTLYTKINSKWIRDLNVRPETIKLLEESTGRTLDINQSKIIYDPPPRVREIKTKVNK